MYIKLCILFPLLTIVSSVSKYNKLLIVSFDGFRYDYLNLNLTPTLNSLKNSSTFADHLINVFPTQTFPNHFTIATGLYTDVHGILGSFVYDKDEKRVLNKSEYKFWHLNEDITPIWTLNENAAKDRHSGTMMWPGNKFSYKGVNSTFQVEFNEVVPLYDRLNESLDWFTHPTTPVNLLMLYIEEPDTHAHMYGPDSNETKDQIKKMDDVAKYIIETLEKKNLLDVNIVFLSDHGMEEVTRDRVIDLRPIVNEDADFIGTSPVYQVHPREGVSTNEIFTKLNKAAEEMKNFRVYLKEDIPDHFHYKSNQRAPPILAVAEPTFAFQDMYDSIQKYVKNFNVSDNGTYGLHGYDPQDINMRPFFIAHGPAFKRNFSVPELRTVDMYSLFCHVLGLELPSLQPNGSFNHVKEIFAPSSSSNYVFHRLLNLLPFAIVISYLYK